MYTRSHFAFAAFTAMLSCARGAMLA